jgi:Na+/H+ antiporter NhaC
MAKRQPKYQNEEEALEKRRVLLLKVLWAVIIIVCILFGYSYGYPIVAQGEVAKGILIGLAYGGGALFVLAVSYFLNRKLRGH